MKTITSILCVGVFVLGGFVVKETSNCQVKPPTVEKTVPDPVFMPPTIGFQGKRATTNNGLPNIPINKMQIGC